MGGEHQPVAQADQPQHPALFSVEYLYMLQDSQVRWAHAKKLKEELNWVRRSIFLCNMELVDRHDGLDDKAKDQDFLDFSEDVEDLEDDGLRHLRETYEEDLLDAKRHMKLATSSWRTLAQAAMRAGDV